MRIAIIALMMSSAVAHAQTTPRMVRLSFSHPDTARHMGVTWHSDSAAQQYVQYGVAAVSEHQASAVASTPLGGGLGVVHSADLPNLTPATTYQYRVGSDADGWSPQTGSFSFTSGPDDLCAPFTFSALGDVRGTDYLNLLPDDGSKWTSVFDRVAADNPAFALIAGDLVYSGNNLDEWNTFLNQGVNYYPFLPVMPSFGNHDKDGNNGAHNYEYLYNLPPNSSGNEQYYYFRYGNMLVMAFNTEASGVNGDFAEQAAWMEQVLVDNPATWKVVFFHHPVWSSTPGETALGCLVCGHPPNEKGQNPTLIDLIDRYDIDLVVQSHNHFYERFAPLRGANDTEVEPTGAFRGTAVGTRDAGGRVPTWGSLYYVTGGGGAVIVPIATLQNLGQVWAAGHEAVNDNYHHLRVSVNDLTMRVDEVGTTSGAVLDTITITKLQQYRVGACGQVGPTDIDGDGFNSTVDCNDDAPLVHPGATEICGDSIDQDCSGGDLVCPPDPNNPGNPSTTPGDLVNEPSGCQCNAGGPAFLLGLAALVLLRRRRD